MPDDLDSTNSEHEGETAEERLLKRIREDYRYCRDYWRDIYEQGAKDMRYASGDPWEADDRREREDAHRPCLAPDELSQYLKQANNNLRQNKRAIKVNPKGAGATDDDAERRASIIRGIEYKSNAQAAYSTAFEQATSCGFGYFRITTEYAAGDSDDVEPRIKRIPNQFTVYLDPDAKEADRSDGRIGFVTDTIRKSDFSHKYPKAKKQSFTTDDQAMAPDWFHGENIVIAEAWQREPIEGKRNQWKVTQYITNGLEILETIPWPGSWIGIVGVFGEEMYVIEGGRARLVMMSLIRRARVPQMMLAYIASQEAEEFGMAPRAPFVGYVGQFESDLEAWKYLNKIPRAFVQVDPVVDGVSGQILPPPTRPQFEPNAQAYEIARESWRRAIQAAMGIAPLPSSAQRQNEKSGVALQRIQTQEAIGSYHFTDNFDRALENAGRQLNELITKVMDTPRHVAVRNPDDSHGMLAVTTSKHSNGEQPMLPEGTENGEYLVADKGEFDVTISTGPNYQSQREEASAFVDLVVQNLKNLPPPGSPPAKILAKAIRLKNLGPIGDELADILDPQKEEQIPPQAQAAIGQLQQQLKAIDAYAQKMQAENEQLKQEKQAKVIEGNFRLQEAREKNETQLAIAEVSTKAQDMSQRLTIVTDLFQKFIDHQQERTMAADGQAHDAAMAAGQQEHEAGMADQQAQNTAAQSAQEAAQQQDLASAASAGTSS